MTKTQELLSHPRISCELKPDGRTEVRFDMRGYGTDIICYYGPNATTKPNQDRWSYELEILEGVGGKYSHPTERGCKIAIHKHFLQAGLIEAQKGSPAITYQCESCGGDNLRADANAAWNPESQQWELNTIFDHCTCEDCGCSTTAIQKVLEQ